jgi:hypothetical protein
MNYIGIDKYHQYSELVHDMSDTDRFGLILSPFYGASTRLENQGHGYAHHHDDHSLQTEESSSKTEFSMRPDPTSPTTFDKTSTRGVYHENNTCRSIQSMRSGNEA